MSDDRFWMSRSEICKLIGMGQEFFRTVIQPALSGEHARQTSGRGRPWRFFAPACVQILLRRSSPSEEQAIWAGAPSPELERLRRAKADLAELEYAQRVGSVVSTEVVYSELLPMMVRVRSAGEELGREFGPRAQQILVETVDECCAELTRRLAPADTTDTEEVPGDDDDGTD